MKHFPPNFTHRHNDTSQPIGYRQKAVDSKSNPVLFPPLSVIPSTVYAEGRETTAVIFCSHPVEPFGVLDAATGCTVTDRFQSGEPCQVYLGRRIVIPSSWVWRRASKGGYGEDDQP